MTQISLKLFNKMPFARNDTGSLSEGRRGRAGRRRHAARQYVVKQGVCTCVSRMIFRKPSRSLRGRVRRHRCRSLLPIIVEWQVCDVRADHHCRTAGNSCTHRLVAAIPVLASSSISIRRWPPRRCHGPRRRFPFSWCCGYSILPTICWPAFFESLRAPASYLPLAFLALAMAGLFWTEDTWPVGVQGLFPV